MKNIAIAVVSASLLCSCALDTATNSEPYQEKEYQTGSNIAKKKTGAVVVDRDEVDRERNTANPALRPGKAN